MKILDFMRFLCICVACVCMYGVGTARADTCAESQIDVNGDGTVCVDTKFSIGTISLDANADFKFSMSAAGTFYVDCGADGTLTSDAGDVSGRTITRSDTDTGTVYTCSYTTGGVKTIRFGGTAMGYSAATYGAAIRFYYVDHGVNVFGGAKIARIDGNMSDMFPWNTNAGADGAQPRFFNTFHSSTNLTNIDENLFANYTTGASDMFYGTFGACTGLTEIPAGLFSGITSGADYMFGGTFAGCTGLTEIPAGLFSSITTGAEDMFLGTFNGCTQLSGYIPAFTFAGLIAHGAPTTTNMWLDTFVDTSVATSCEPYGMAQYITGYEGNDNSGENWNTRVSCGYLVQYDCNGGANAPGNYVAALDMNFTPAANTCELANAMFTGWAVSNTEGPVVVQPNVPFQWTYEENKTLTAQWECDTGYHDNGEGVCVPNEITVVYQSSQGTPPSQTTCTYGQSFNAADAITDAGNSYIFGGWLTTTAQSFSAGASIPCNFDNLGVYSGTAYIDAQWTCAPGYEWSNTTPSECVKKKYTLRFNCNANPDLYEAIDGVTMTRQIEFGEQITLPRMEDMCRIRSDYDGADIGFWYLFYWEWQYNSQTEPVCGSAHRSSAGGGTFTLYCPDNDEIDISPQPQGGNKKIKYYCVTVSGDPDHTDNVTYANKDSYEVWTGEGCKDEKWQLVQWHKRIYNNTHNALANETLTPDTSSSDLIWVPSSDVHYYGEWERVPIGITFHHDEANNAENLLDIAWLKYGEAFYESVGEFAYVSGYPYSNSINHLSTIPTRTGYTFNGYQYCYDDAGNNVCITVVGADGNFTNNLQFTDTGIDVYAQWIPTCNEITLDPNGGDSGTIVSLYKKTDNPTLYLNDTCTTEYSTTTDVISSRTGYTFRGFHVTNYDDVSIDDPAKTDQVLNTQGAATTYNSTWQINGSATIYAAWAQDCIAPQNGTCTLTVETDGAVDYTICEAGYQMVGTECIESTYTVTYDCNGGNGENPANGTATTNVTFVPDTADSCARDNIYVFNGWAISGTNDVVSAGEPGFTWNYDEDKIFTAQWECVDGYEWDETNGECVKTYTATFDCNYTHPSYTQLQMFQNPNGGINPITGIHLNASVTLPTRDVCVLNPNIPACGRNNPTYRPYFHNVNFIYVYQNQYLYADNPFRWELPMDINFKNGNIAFSTDTIQYTSCGIGQGTPTEASNFGVSFYNCNSVTIAEPESVGCTPGPHMEFVGWNSSSNTFQPGTYIYDDDTGWPYGSIGLIAQWTCKYGYQMNDAGTACEPCSDNEIFVEGACQPCAPGTMPNSEGTACEPCADNEIFVDGVCQPCEPGTMPNADGTECIECPEGQHLEFGQCVDDVVECSIPDAVYATRTWNDTIGGYGSCMAIECVDGYHIASNACVLDSQVCEIENGLGTSEWHPDTNQWGACQVTDCNPGFELSGNECVACENRLDENGDVAVSTYASNCEIASCMYQGQKYILDDNECRLICEDREDDTGIMFWNDNIKKCIRTCNPGYKI